jgi:hypothetical protein
MIAIIYLDKPDDPFYCFNIPCNHPITWKSEQIIIENIPFLVEDKIKDHRNHIRILCNHTEIEKLNKHTANYDFDRFDISHHYKRTPGKIKPIWVVNNYGKQINFLIS